jgi:hypothetical protein
MKNAPAFDTAPRNIAARNIAAELHLKLSVLERFPLASDLYSALKSDIAIGLGIAPWHVSVLFHRFSQVPIRNLEDDDGNESLITRLLVELVFYDAHDDDPQNEIDNHYLRFLCEEVARQAADTRSVFRSTATGAHVALVLPHGDLPTAVCQVQNDYGCIKS